MDRSAAVLCVQGIGERDIDGDELVDGVDGGDDAIPILVFGAGGPLSCAGVGIGDAIHADVVDPVGRAGAVHNDRVANVQVGRSADVEGIGADGDVGVGDGIGRARDGGSRT